MRNYDQQKYVQSNNIAIKIMSEKDLASRPRSMSAKPANNRSRPISGMTINTIKMSSKNLKTELIASIYQSKEKSPSRKNFPRTIIYQGATTEQLPRPKKMHVFETTRSKQQLYEQNLQLKRQINKIAQELAISKGKSQSKSKKILSKEKQLNMEFEKEMYWAGSKSHMITGIKHQYERLKKQYAEQSALCEQLKIALTQSKLPEYKIYAESVQVQNRRLADKLKMLAAAQNEAIKRLGPDKQVSVALAAENQQNLRMFEAKLNQQDIQLRNARESLSDKDKKIQFLEQLIIQKDNKQYHMGRKIKKLEAQKSDLQQQLQEHKNYITQSQKEKTIKNQQKQYGHKQQLIKQQTHYQNKIQELNRKVRHFEEQNKVLEITVNKLRMSSSNVHNSYANGSTEGQLKKSNIRRRSTMIQSNNPDKSGQQTFFIQGQNSKKLQNFDSVQSKNLQQQDNSEGQPEKEKQKEKRQRVVQRADKKHSENSKKMRRVEADEIKQIGDLLKYRMIFLKIDPKTLKSYFDYKLGPKSQLGDDQTGSRHLTWEQKYINMKQVETILCEIPFTLPKQSSHLLSRYIIEDCNEQFVYCDQNNENTRQIIKSIIKSTIGDYQLPTNDILKMVGQFMDKYETNLQSALRTYYPSGKVSRNKLVDTINGLGVQVTSDVAEYIVALACRNSKRMEQIQYNALFNQQAKASLTSF